MTNNLIPFDLEKALEGEQVITRDGKDVTQFTFFRTKKYDPYPIFGVVNGELQRFQQSGKRMLNDYPHHLDLFMKPELIESWVNVYINCNRLFVGQGSFETKEDAISNLNPSMTYIKTIKIDNQ